MARTTPVRACWVSRWVKVALYHYHGDYDWPYITQMPGTVLVESRDPKVLGTIAQHLAKRGDLDIHWGGQWLSARGDWENWLEVRRGR